MSYLGCLRIINHDLNEKLFKNLSLFQILAFTHLDAEYPERLRRRMKNDEKYLYRYVLQNMDIMKAFKEGKVTPLEVQKSYAKCWAEQLEEKTLRALDDEE